MTMRLELLLLLSLTSSLILSQRKPIPRHRIRRQRICTLIRKGQ
jgi:hypothetical protein